jgi:predicted transcriptional regulator
VSAEKIKLTGDTVQRIRHSLNESQKTFAERFSVTQPVIHRIEKAADKEHDGPLIILVKQLADEIGFAMPGAASTRADEMAGMMAG